MKSGFSQPMPDATDAESESRAGRMVVAGAIPNLIEQSWQRCRTLGVDEAPSVDMASADQIRQEKEKCEVLVHYALPVMEALFEQIVDSHSTVILSNADGFILQSLGDSDFLDRARRIALMPGVDWSEDKKGTNAIGLALTEAQAVVVHGEQHFFPANHFLTCSASPIVDTTGQILGVLDVTGDHRSYSPHSLALVKMSVRMLENRMFVNSFPTGVVLHFHDRPEFIGTLNEGLIAFAPDGRTVAANRAACRQFGIASAELRRSSFEDLFQQPVRALLDQVLLRKSEPLKLRTRAGHTIYGQVTPGREMKSPTRIFTYPRAEEKPAAAESSAADHVPEALERLNTGDPQISLLIHKLRRVVGRDIPILIHGETGAGKELLARAIHDDGPRFEKPFMAVNCAAIPEGLIESELFGYDEGAFTGAKRKGSIGKIIQADGGTLFLDEIGDMPMSLQARLLRVLQERLVNPLGSTKSIPVDIHLVCATHRRLKGWVAAGKFREDLYYRLNGLTVNLPPLRQRNDLAALVDLIISREAPPGTAPQVAPEVMAMFQRHPWPGNIRQLSNLLRTALVMAGDESAITVEHLPDDFLEELDAQAPELVAAAQRATQTEAPPAEPVASPAAVAINLAGDIESATLALIQRTLEQHYGNVSAAARQLGVSRNTLYRKLKQIWQV
jgi:transcriptional regulator of acetoin/glycerol metabolism